MPPDDLLNEFIQNGEMPITNYWYSNDAYSDSNSDSKSLPVIISGKEFSGWLDLVKNMSHNSNVIKKLQNVR